MGLKTPKLHSGLLKNTKSFTLNSILLNKMNYMLLFKLFAYILKYRNLHHKLLVLLKQTMALPIFLDTLNNFYHLFLLNILQAFLIIHRHKT